MKEQFVKITNDDSSYWTEILKVNKFYEDGRISVFDPENVNSTLLFLKGEYELVKPPNAIEGQS